MRDALELHTPEYKCTVCKDRGSVTLGVMTESGQRLSLLNTTIRCQACKLGSHEKIGNEGTRADS